MVNTTYCSQLLSDGVVGSGDADIAGIGICVAFLLSAFSTLTAVLVAYATGLVDAGLLRPVDRLILRVPSRAANHPKLHVTLRKAVITLSDQQIITGIAVLGACFQGLRAGTITVYHYQICVYLAWMSSSVHLSALTLLRPFLWHHRGMMIWRVIGMLTLMIMLIIALVPTLSNDWAVVGVNNDPNFWSPRNGFGVPALCFWGELYGDGVNPDAILSLIILVVSYLWKMGGLFMPVREGWQSYCRNPLDALLDRPLALIARRYKQHQASKRLLLLFRAYLMLWLPANAILEILSSFSAAIWLSVLGTIYGSMQIIIPRSIVQEMDPSIAYQESLLSFGQLLPLILLVQPLGAISEHIWLFDQDDEEVYGPESDISHGTAQISADDVSQSTSSRRSLLDIMSTSPKTHLFRESSDKLTIRIRLYQSRTFAILVWWIHIGIAIVACLTFSSDGFNIGWDTSFNWLSIAAASGAFIGATGLLMSILVPFTSLAHPSLPQTESCTPSRQSSDLTGRLELKLIDQYDSGNTNERSISPASAEAGAAKVFDQGRLWHSHMYSKNQLL